MPRGSLLKLQTAAKQPLHNERKILPHVRFGSLRVKVWFRVVHSLDIDMFLGTSYIDQILYGIFPSERQVVPWKSHPAAVLSTNHHQQTESLQEAAPIWENKITDRVKYSPIPIRIAPQIFHASNAQHSVLATTPASGILSVISRTDGHLERINIAKQSIAFLSLDTTEVHSTAYRACQKPKRLRWPK